jgi:hypothetical protein
VAPDGRTIAFERGGELYLIPADGGRAHRIPLPRDFIISALVQPDWRPMP